MEDRHRITKDTSARKTPGAVSALEVTAIKASYEAYITSMKAGHEEIMQSMHAEHAAELSDLTKQSEANLAEVKTQLSEERSKSAEKQRVAADAAAKDAAAACLDRNATLRAKIDTLEENIATLEAKLKDAIADGAQRETAAKQDAAKLQGRIDNLKKAHLKDVKDLERQLAVGPNSWLQLRFKGKGRPKPRIYWQRYTAPLREAVEQLAKDMGGVSAENYVFRRAGESGEVLGKGRTLQELGFEDGQEIWFEKK